MTYLRRLPRFEYLAPRTIDEACALVGARREQAGLLAGGTDLLLQLRRRERSPACVIGLKGVAELAGLRALPDGGLSIGATTALQTLLTSPLVRSSYGVLAEAAALIGGPELRHVATIGGNVAGALPCADLPPVLMTLGARLTLRSPRGERTVALDDFYPELGRTIAAPDEILTEILLPAPPSPRNGGVYLKFHDRQSMDMTTVGVGAFVAWDEGVLRNVRIALASSAPVTLRARRAEALLEGKPLSEALIDEAGAIACEESAPRSSWRASREHRLALVNVLTRRAVRRACDKAMASEGAST
jgi:carbon-monoxide dehydrogenase medium subunit